MNPWTWFANAVLAIHRLLDRAQVARKVLLYTTLWMTIDSYMWCRRFAEESQRQGTEIAAIIGAVLLAVSALQGYVFKAYLEGRPTKEQNGG